MPSDALVDPRQIPQNPAKQFFGKLIARWRCFFVIADQQGTVVASHNLLRRGATNVPLKHHLQRLLPCTMTGH